MPLNVPRKRTFAATSAYESDAENNENGSSRARRQRTSSTTSVETIRALSLAKALAPGPATRRVLQPSTGGNLIGSVTTAPKEAVNISKPEPPQPSGIPRSVALTAKRVANNTASSVTQHNGLLASSKPSLSTRTKPSPAAPVVVKVIKLKESLEVPSHGGSVSAIDMVSSSSNPDPSETKKATTTLKLRSASSSQKSLESLLSAEKKALLPSRTSYVRKDPQLEHRVSSSQLMPAVRDEPTKGTLRERRPLVTDSTGCVHLAPSDCELRISFVNSPHYEVWDIGDGAHVACPAYLYIMAKDASQWAGTPLAQPDITLINIECRAKKGPSRYSDRHAGLDHWSCRFDGMELPTASGPIASANVPPGAISIEMKWDRVYWMPPTAERGKKVDKGDVDRAPQPSPTRKANSLSSLLSAGSQGGNDGRATDDPRAGVPGRGWCMKFWIPIPARLFLRKETRMFEIDAKVHIVPGVDRRTIDVGRDYGFIAAQREMTVSHLRSEREMVVPL